DLDARPHAGRATSGCGQLRGTHAARQSPAPAGDDPPAHRAGLCGRADIDETLADAALPAPPACRPRLARRPTATRSPAPADRYARLRPLEPVERHPGGRGRPARPAAGRPALRDGGPGP